MSDEKLDIEDQAESSDQDQPKRGFDLKTFIIESVLKNPKIRGIVIGAIVVVALAIVISLVSDVGDKELTIRMERLPDIKCVLTKKDRDGKQSVVTMRLGILYLDEEALVEELEVRRNIIVDELLNDVRSQSIEDILIYEKREKFFSKVVSVVKESLSDEWYDHIMTVYLDDILVKRTGK